jgi:hypothetical protein
MQHYQSMLRDFSNTISRPKKASLLPIISRNDLEGCCHDDAIDPFYVVS